MHRFETDQGSTVFDKAEFPDYPYSARAPYDATWVTAAEVAARGGGLDRSEPNAWGTLGEFLDLNIESGSMPREEIEEIIETFAKDGRALVAGGVGTGIEIVRIEGPVEASAPSP